LIGDVSHRDDRQIEIGRHDHPAVIGRGVISLSHALSAVERTGTMTGSTPSDGAAASIERMKNLDCGAVSGLNITATRASPGATSLSRSSHLLPTENSNPLKPVMLPPGYNRQIETYSITSSLQLYDEHALPLTST
jgi:hypothetical protein